MFFRLTFRVAFSSVLITIVMLTASFAHANTFTTKQLIRVDDLIPPSIPSGVVATGVAQTQIDISWTASTDNIGVVGYVLFRDGFMIATVTAPQTTYSDASLSASTTYAYTLQAFDADFNYSTSSATATASTFTTAVATTTAITTAANGRPGTTHTLTPESFIIDVAPGTDRALVNTSSPLPVQLRLMWGDTYDVSEGTIDTPLYKQKHETLVTGLTPNTDYWLLVIATDGQGRSIEKRVKFHTQSDIRETIATNPSNFEAHALEDGIHLTWKNPTEASFKEVRIMRKEGDIATDPYDGVPIYEGAREAFIDKTVADGGIYGYTIFARTGDGSFSSGAVLVVRAFSKQTIGDAQVVVVPHGGHIADGKNLLDALTIIQDGIAHDAGDGRFILAGDRAFTLSLSINVVPHVLKTIVVTMRDPAHLEKTFSFLLRINAEGSAYEARVGALGRNGAFETILSVLNAETQSIESTAFTIESQNIAIRYGRDHESSGGTHRTQLVIYSSLLLIVFLIIARFLLKRKHNEKTNKK